MSNSVELRDLTPGNRAAVAGLGLSPDQEDLVASNAESIREARSDPGARPRVIYAGEDVVGFLMYDAGEPDDEPREALIYRFMIDQRHQGRGYGRAALALAIDEIRTVDGVRKLSISYMPDNPTAKPFYAKLRLCGDRRGRRRRDDCGTYAVTAVADPALQRDLNALAPPQLLIGHRLIAPGDEDALLPEEAASMSSRVTAMRRASGAARIVARALFVRLGHDHAAVPRGSSGAPIWPAGLTGSLAHDERIAVAAAGWQRDVHSVGIDIEPAAPLPADMLALVATSRELEKTAGDALRGRLLFAAKEAVYKAVYPLDRDFLEFQDIEVDIEANSAVTNSGRALALRYCMSSSRIVTLALA